MGEIKCVQVDIDRSPSTWIGHVELNCSRLSVARYISGCTGTSGSSSIAKKLGFGRGKKSELDFKNDFLPEPAAQVPRVRNPS